MSTLATTSVVPLYAGFWRRAAAALLDGLVLIIPNVVINLFLPSGVGQLLATVIVGCAYYAYFHSSASQATPGKKAFGIKVTDLAGERIGLGRAIGRYFGTWLSSIILGIGFLMAAFTGKRQALHDLICGTLVVNRAADGVTVAAGGDVMPITGGVWAAIVLLLLLPFGGGIVAAVSIPAYQDYVTRTKVHEVIAAAAPLKQDVERALSERRAITTGSVPVSSKYASGAQVSSDGQIVIGVSDAIAKGGRIRFAPTGSAGAVQWKCSADDVPNKILPAACRG